MDYLQRISRELDLPRAEKQQALAEIRAHFEDIRDDLMSKGASLEDAEKEAAEKLGSPDSVAAGLGAVHLRDGWKSTLFAALPFLAILPVMMMVLGRHARQLDAPEDEMMTWYLVDLNRPLILTGAALLIVFAVVMLVVGLREVLRDKRPAWLATFLAIAIYWPVGLLLSPELPFALTMSRVRVGYAAMDLSDSHQFRDQVMLFICYYYVVVPLLLIACTRINKLKLFGVIALISIVAATLFKGYISLLYVLLPLVSPIVAGFVLFARHRYSTPSRASLFIYAGYVFVAVTNAPTINGLGLADAFLIAVLPALAATVLYSRSVNKLIKYAVLMGGVAACAVLYVGDSSPYCVPFLVVILLVVLSPALFERRRALADNALIAE